MARKRKKVRSLRHYRKKKTNTKLLAILGVSMFALLVGVGGLWFFVEYRGATRNMNTGDALFAEGDYNSAKKQYGRAVTKEPNNIEFVIKLREAILKITPSTPDESRVLYNEYIQSLMHVARYSPNNLEVQLDVVKEMYDAAYLSSQNEYWRKLYASADMGLERISPDDPRRHELMLYRGLAQLHIEDASMTEAYDDEGNIRFPGETDLEYVLDHDPGNAVAWSALAHGRMAIYYRLKNEGRTQQARKNKFFADETMARSLEVAGTSFDVLMTYFREVLLQRNVLRQQYVQNPETVTQEQLDEFNANVSDARNKLINAYDPSDYRVRIGELVTLTISSDQQGAELTVPLLEAHIQMHPKDFSKQFMLASILKRLRQYEESIVVAQNILDAEQQTAGIYAIEQFGARPLAAHLLLESTIQQAMLSKSDGEKEALIEEAEKYNEVLSDLVSHDQDNPMLLHGYGLIALAKADYKTAVNYLEKVIRRNPGVDAQVYRESAIALAESDARGLANERLAIAIQKEPDNLSNYILKARMEIMISNYASAEQTLSVLTPSARSRESVQDLLNVIELQKGGKGTRFTDPVLQVIAEVGYAAGQEQFESAIEIVDNGLAQHGPDWRLFSAKGNIFLAQDKSDEALVWMKKALELNPDAENLKRFVISLEADNPIQAFISHIQTLELEESEETIRLAVQLYEYSMIKFSLASRWARTGHKTNHDYELELAEKALVASKEYQEKARSIGADLTEIYRVQLDHAVVEKDFEKATSILRKLESATSDPQILKHSQIRLELAQADQAKEDGELEVSKEYLGKALNNAKLLVEDFPFVDVGWRALGGVYMQSGEPSKALDAYSEAYRIAPNKLENARRYVGALAVSNLEPQRLLRVIRNAIVQFPNNKQIRGAWLEVQRTIGNPWEVYNYRIETYRLRPNDRENAIMLASFLVNQTPSREFLRHPDGNERYTARVWTQLEPGKRQKVLIATQEIWDGIIEEIMVASSKEVDVDLRIAGIHAAVARDRGQMNVASEIWDRFIESLEGTDEYSNVVIAAADFLQQSSRFEQSISLLEDARDAQTENMELDAALGSVLYVLGRHEEAAVSLEKAVLASGNRILHARWVESLALSGQFEKADNALVGYKSTNTAYSEAMLRALISRVRSEQLLAQGDIQGGTAELTKYRTALRIAIAFDESNPVPYIHLCRSLLNEYRLTQNKALLEEAIVVADEGAKQDANSEEFAVVKTDVLQADGQLLRAIDRLSTHLLENPDADIVRQRLIEAYLDTDEIERALSTAKAGVTVDPSDPTWYHRLGDLHLRSSDNRAEALLAYLESIERNPNVAMLFKIDEITNTDQLLPNQALLKMTRGPLSKSHPIIGSIEAKALLGLGRRRDALIAMTNSWNSFENAIEQNWISEASMANWYIDLQHIFAENPEGGKQFILSLNGEDLNGYQIAGLASFFKAYGGDYVASAIDLLKESVELEPVGSDSRTRILMLLGGYLIEIQRYEEGELVFTKLAEENDSPLILNNLAYVIGVYRNRPEEGLEIAKVAAMKAPRVPQIIDTVAALHERSGNPQKAAETLEFLLQVSPANALAMSKLAILYSGPLGQPQRGVVFAERARSQNPRLPEVLDALGWSYYQTGKSAKGEEFLQKSLKRGETENAYVHLAQLVMDKGEFDEALGYLRIAQELSQDDYSLNRIKTFQDDIRNKRAAIGG